MFSAINIFETKKNQEVRGREIFLCVGRKHCNDYLPNKGKCKGLEAQNSNVCS